MMGKYSKQDKFAIRKLTVGAASVLIGCTWIGLSGQVVHADEVENLTTTQEKTVKQDSDVDKKNDVQVENDQNENTPQQVHHILENKSQVNVVKKDLDTNSKTKSTQTKQSNKDESDKNTTKLTNKDQSKVAAQAKAAVNTTQSSVNIDDWGTINDPDNSDNLIINSYHGSTEQPDIVLPNTFDFRNNNKISSTGKVYIDDTFLKNLAQNAKSIRVDDTGDSKLYIKGECSNTFAENKSLQTVDLSHLDTSEVTDLHGFFSDMNSLESVDVTGWKFGKLTKLPIDDPHSHALDFLFAGSKKLSTIKGIEDWDTTGITGMSQMFNGINVANLDLHKWDVSSVTDMQSMFASNPSLKTINITGWKPSAVGTLFNQELSQTYGIRQMFYQCPELTTIEGIADFGKYTGSVQNMNNTFGKDPKLTNLDLSNWDMHNVRNMVGMFNGDSELESVGDLSNWNLAKLDTVWSENDGGVFEGCSKLKSIGHDLSNWNLSNVQTMRSMFSGCSSLTVLTGINNWDVRKVTNLDSTFQGMSSITNLDLSNWKTDSLSNLGYTFNGFGNSNTDLNVSNWDTSQVENLNMTFMGAGLKKIKGLSTWNTENITSLMDTFFECSQLTELDLTGWNATKFENMLGTFWNTPNLKEIKGIENWRTPNLNNLNATFYNCGATKLDLHNWTTDKVTTIVAAFYKSGVQDLNMQGLDLSQADGTSAFSSLQNPATIDLRKAKLPKSLIMLGNFMGDKPLIVYSENSDLQKLNHVSTHSSNGEQSYGRQNSNYLTYYNGNDVITTDGNDVITTEGMDFVYSSPEEFNTELQKITSKAAVEQILSHKPALSSEWQADQDLDLPHNYLKYDKKNEPIQLVVGKYYLTFKAPIKYSQDDTRMNMDVTRTIKYDVAGTDHAAIPDQVQKVHYIRKDANGNAGYIMKGKITWVAWTPEGGKAEFSAKDVDQIEGYNSYVDGVKATKAPLEEITEKDGVPQNGKTITVSYKKQETNPIHTDPKNNDINNDIPGTTDIDGLGGQSQTLLTE